MEKLLFLIILLNVFASEVLADAALPQPPYCGKSNLSSLRGRVFNGTYTGLDEFPWLAHIANHVLLFQKIPMGGGFCTSSLITSNWVLTAAHCVFSEYAYQYPLLFSQFIKVTLGDWDDSKNPDCDENNKCAPKSITLSAAALAVHPKYITKNGFRYDIALLRLERSVEFSPFIQPICLPGAQKITNYEGLKVTITGWGRHSNSQAHSNIKRKHLSVITDHGPCQEWYGEDMELSVKHQLCVGGPDGGACNGDSGGPLLLESSNDKNAFYQIGVASLGRQECVNISRPTVYIRVDTFIDWISETMEQNDRS